MYWRNQGFQVDDDNDPVEENIPDASVDVQVEDKPIDIKIGDEIVEIPEKLMDVIPIEKLK